MILTKKQATIISNTIADLAFMGGKFDYIYLPDGVKVAWYAQYEDSVTAIGISVKNRTVEEYDSLNQFDAAYKYVGKCVVFKPKVYSAPYTPYYDKYKGHTFVVTDVAEDHYALKCISDSNVIVDGYVHEDDLEVL